MPNPTPGRGQRHPFRTGPAGGGRMTMTGRQAAQLVDAAIASGRIPPWRRGYWLGRIAAGGRVAGEAVTQLVMLSPATPDVVASWDRDPRTRRTAAWAAGPQVSDQDLYDRLYPRDEIAAVWAERRDRDAQRRAARAAGVAAPSSPLPDLTAQDLAPEPPGHDPHTGQHDHQHPDYAGGMHSHLHEHTGDADHGPGRFGHQHGTHSETGTAAASAELGELYDRLFGKPQ
jgi:hypothetical protein